MMAGISYLRLDESFRRLLSYLDAYITSIRVTTYQSSGGKEFGETCE